MNYHTIQLRVRYGETDQMGVVYHGNYAQYFEVGRVEWLRNIGVSYDSMEKEGVMLPVVSLQIKYKKPAYYDQLLTLKTVFKKMAGVRIEFDYELFNESGELLTVANSILVFMDKKTGKPVTPPDSILKALN